MFIQINDKIVNLDYVKAIRKSENTNHVNETTYYIHFYIYSKDQAFTVAFKSKDERDEAFKFIEEQIDLYNKLKISGSASF